MWNCHLDDYGFIGAFVGFNDCNDEGTFIGFSDIKNSNNRVPFDGLSTNQEESYNNVTGGVGIGVTGTLMGGIFDGNVGGGMKSSKWAITPAGNTFDQIVDLEIGKNNFTTASLHALCQCKTDLRQNLRWIGLFDCDNIDLATGEEILKGIGWEGFQFSLG